MLGGRSPDGSIYAQALTEVHHCKRRHTPEGIQEAEVESFRSSPRSGLSVELLSTTR